VGSAHKIFFVAPTYKCFFAGCPNKLKKGREEEKKGQKKGTLAIRIFAKQQKKEKGKKKKEFAGRKGGGGRGKKLLPFSFHQAVSTKPAH